MAVLPNLIPNVPMVSADSGQILLMARGRNKAAPIIVAKTFVPFRIRFGRDIQIYGTNIQGSLRTSTGVDRFKRGLLMRTGMQLKRTVGGVRLRRTVGRRRQLETKRTREMAGKD